MVLLIRILIVFSLCLNLSCGQQETFSSLRTKAQREYLNDFKQEEDPTPIEFDENPMEGTSSKEDEEVIPEGSVFSKLWGLRVKNGHVAGGYRTLPLLAITEAKTNPCD